MGTHTHHVQKHCSRGLDFSVGEHVSSGETYQQALLRGFEEEAGFTADPSQLITLGKTTPEGGMDFFQTAFKYLYMSPEDPAINPEDHTHAEWLYPNEVINKIEAGTPAKDDILPTIQRYFTD